MIEQSGSSFSAKIFYYGAAFFGFIAFDDFQAHVVGPSTWIIPLIIGGILAGIGQWIDEKNYSHVQFNRDLCAGNIFKKIKKGEPTDSFYLYLRPFFITSSLTEKNWSKSPVGLSPDYFQPEHIELEEVLANSLYADGPLIGLGRPGENIGAGKLPSNEDKWMQDVLLMMSKSTRIFIIPGYQEGVVKEIEALKDEGYLNKTIFIKPPKSEHLDVSDFWEKTEDTLEKLSIYLLGSEDFFKDEGIFMSVDADGVLEDKKMQFFSLNESPKQIRKSLSIFLNKK